MDVLLVDDTCALCNKTVAFITAKGGDEKFTYLSLYSEEGKEILKSQGLPADYDDSIVLIQNGKTYTESGAALHVAKKTKGITKVLYAFIVLPAPIRDWVYRIVSKHRHRIVKSKNWQKLPHKK